MQPLSIKPYNERDLMLYAFHRKPTEGSVDVIVRLDGQEPIYRGNGQQNADFVLETTETGSYHISVSGHQAKGCVSFTRIPGWMAIKRVLAAERK